MHPFHSVLLLAGSYVLAVLFRHYFRGLDASPFWQLMLIGFGLELTILLAAAMMMAK